LTKIGRAFGKNWKINLKSNWANEKTVPLGSEADTTEHEHSNPNTTRKRCWL